MPHKDNDTVKQGETSPSTMMLIGKSNIPTSPMQSSSSTTSGMKDETPLHNAVVTTVATVSKQQQSSASTTVTCTVTPSPAVLVAAAATAKEKELPTPRNLSYTKASIPTSPVTLPRKEEEEEEKKQDDKEEASNNNKSLMIAGPPLIVRHAHAQPALAAAYPYYAPHYYPHAAAPPSLYPYPPYGYMPAPYSLASAPTAPPTNPFAPMSPIATTKRKATTDAAATAESPPRKHFRLMRQEEKEGETTKGEKQQQQTVCVPLEDPLQHWKQMMAHPDRHSDVLLPDFGQLVNYPHFLGHVSRSKNRPAPGTQASQQQQPPPAGHKGCVMCGQWRRSAASSASGMDGMASTASSDILIPRQNKGVCTACDVVIWKLEDDSNSTTTPTTFKWCKGCKNFKAWAAFGRKSNATKCEKCRTRQKQKYAQKKQYMNSTTSNSSIAMEEGAVQGLQSLWAASSTTTTASTSS